MLPDMTKLSTILKWEYVDTLKFLLLLEIVKGDNDSAIMENHLFCNHSSGLDYFSILANNNNGLNVTLMENILTTLF